MCRLLGVMTTSPSTLHHSLGQDLDAFRGMSEVHCDGWGAACWDDRDDLLCEKAPEAALHSAGFTRMSNGISTDAGILHLRKASPGMINWRENTHPFVVGSIAFAHNGYAWPPISLDRILGEVHADEPMGQTDSEQYFQIVLALMREMSAIEALDQATAMISQRADYLSLNCMMLTHDALYAVELWDAAAVAEKGDDPDTFTLRYRVGQDRVEVASSGWQLEGTEWEQLSSGRLLEVRRGDLRTRVHHLHSGRATAA